MKGEGINARKLGDFPDTATANAFAVQQGWLHNGCYFYNTSTSTFWYLSAGVWKELACLLSLNSQAFLLFNGAAQDTTLNGGRYETIIMRKVAANPGFQFKFPDMGYNTGRDIVIMLFFAHSVATQTLDIDLDDLIINPGDNVNTKAPELTQSGAPTSPITPYEMFTQAFALPHAGFDPAFRASCRITRDTAGADIGDLHLLDVFIYQF